MTNEIERLIAWVAGPWAMSTSSSRLVVPAVVLLVAMPGVFSTPNEKRKIVVATRGSIRVALELVLYSVALAAPWFVWSPIVAGFSNGVVVLLVVFGVPRLFWLLRGAPLQD